MYGVVIKCTKQICSHLSKLNVVTVDNRFCTAVVQNKTSFQITDQKHRVHTCSSYVSKKERRAHPQIATAIVATAELNIGLQMR